MTSSTKNFYNDVNVFRIAVNGTLVNSEISVKICDFDISTPSFWNFRINCACISVPNRKITTEPVSLKSNLYIATFEESKTLTKITGKVPLEYFDLKQGNRVVKFKGQWLPVSRVPDNEIVLLFRTCFSDKEVPDITKVSVQVDFRRIR